MGNKMNWRKWLPPAAVILVLLAAWQIAVTVTGTGEWLLPSPLRIIETAAEVWPRLSEHMLATIELVLPGFAGGVGAGFLLAALLHFVPGAKSGIYPLLVLSQNVPIIAIGPLLTLWFGYGIVPKLILMWLVCFFPVSVALLAGLNDVDPKLRNYMEMIGSSRWQLFWRLELPNAVSHLFSGLKIAASYSVLTAVVAEWIGSQKGLGYFMLLASNGFQTARVFAAVFLIVILSLLMYGLVSLAERLLVRWKQVQKGSERR
ncbi:ABC transporter permease [Paenibacillus protaetiae]|uniref:ABC transporter permease n=1 Tax=Paenibacillus protaetiae TaxID=2509456 RepID=A0A4P6ET21_9BACL|nr:ABC transporter permease [Paenibacillus protaetiae]QAY65555.1 ABC transporter permease [Paenibacillus protaetiae]